MDVSTNRNDASYKVLAFCQYFEPGFRGGGPVRSIAEILDTASERVEITLVTRDRDLGARLPYPGLAGRWVNRNKSRIFYIRRFNLLHWLRWIRVARRSQFDLLYLNSLWSPSFTIIPFVARFLRLYTTAEVLIATRGEMSVGALNLKARKKRWFLRLWKPVLKFSSVRFHASSADEAADITRHFGEVAIEIASDQIVPPRSLPWVEPAEGPTRLVFIGRISPMKNLLLALESISTIERSIALDVYGPIEDAEYWQRCLTVIQKLPNNVVVDYRGVLDHSDVAQTFCGYDGFLFPTLGENFGHVIAESLSAGCPVICSKMTPWTSTLTGGGGVVLESLQIDSWTDEIARWSRFDKDQKRRAKMSAASAYVEWCAQQRGRNILNDLAVERGE